MKYLKRTLFLVLSFFFCFTLLACDKEEENNEEVKIKIEMETSMTEGMTYDYSVKLDSKVTTDYEISLTPSGVIEIDKANSKVKALSAGTVTVTVSASGKEESIIVNVIANTPTQYTITYNLNGGTASGLADKYDGTEDLVLGNPTREGYTFAGWYENEDFSGDVVEKIVKGTTGNKVFYAKWEEEIELVEYTWTLDTQGADPVDPIKFTVEDSKIVLPILERTGYNFKGWYTKETGGTMISDFEPAKNPVNMTLYARWEIVRYDIKYELDGGEVNTPTLKYTVELEVELKVPSRLGFKFEGWYDNAEFNGEPVTKIEKGTTGNKVFYAKWFEIERSNKLVVNAEWADKDEGDEVEVNGETYTIGLDAHATIDQAISSAKEYATIYLVGGTYDEALNIKLQGLTITGFNDTEDVTLNKAIITGVVTVAADDVTLKGLAFTGAAKVKGSTVDGFRFLSNYVYDTNANGTAWAEAANAEIGWLNMRGTSAVQINNYEFANNYFKNVQDSCIALAYVHNVIAYGNKFEDYRGDGIRFDTGGYNDGLLSFTNNEFIQTEKGGATGIYFRIYGGTAQNTDIVIKGNLFKNIGNVNNLYCGAISARNYQEHGAYITISNNDFIDCKNYIRLRNNATAANHSTSIWECIIENNNFIGAPAEYYFVNKNASDGESTNPSLTVVKGNFYADSEGNKITPNASFFKDCKSVAEGLAERVEHGTIEGAKFYSISYNLNGGEYKGALTTRYHDLTDEIVLPTPLRTGYIFMGWYVGQTKYEIVTGNMKEDLELEAIWKKDERVFIEFTAELNGGNWNYDSYEDVALDLLNDYNIYGGTGYTRTSIPTGPWVNINFHTFFYAEVNGAKMNEKWAWLAEYLGEVGGKSNYKACGLLNDKTDSSSFDAVNANYKYAVSYEFRGFIMGKQHDTNASYLSADWSLAELRNGIWSYIHENQSNKGIVEEGDVNTLPVPHKPYYTFEGWYLDAELTKAIVDNAEELVEGVTLYAKWRETNPVLGLEITNKIEELLYKGTYTLIWVFNPTDASNKNIKITSSDENVLTVNSKGEIYAQGEGVATITVVSESNPDAKDTVTIVVYSPDRINAEFVDNSYAEVGESLQIHAEYISRNDEVKQLVWTSKNPSVATVDENGLVTGVSAGTAIITVSVEGTEISMDIEVTIIESGLSDIMNLIVSSHNSNVYVTEQMLIALAYETDIHGSVSDILYNYEYKVDESIKIPLGNNRPGTKMSSVEFITVHYTAGAPASSTAQSTANYFKNGGGGASIHYCTGNDGIFHTMPDDEVAYHAGDGTSTKFSWNPTGVKVKADDPARPVVDVSSDGYFTVNGEKTTIKCPGGYDKNLGQNVQPNDQKNYFTLLGPAIDVFNGEYHIGSTWWCNSQVAEGAVSSLGGNLNSIGIESACNMGSDLWYTWQITAQLVANLMIQNDLAINRVVGHNFFSGKNCPQPLLEYEGEIWWQFIECVESEYEILTKYQDYEISFESNNPEIVNDKGRVVNRPLYTTSVSYTVTIKKGNDVQKVTLSSIVPGFYEKVME